MSSQGLYYRMDAHFCTYRPSSQSAIIYQSVIQLTIISSEPIILRVVTQYFIFFNTLHRNQEQMLLESGLRTFDNEGIVAQTFPGNIHRSNFRSVFDYL